MKLFGKMMAVILAAVMVAAITPAFAAETADVVFDTPVSFTFASAGRAGSTDASMVEEWIDRIQTESGGMITVDYQPGAALGNQYETFQQTVDGQIEACTAGIATYQSYNPNCEIFQLPFLITNYDLEWKALNSPEWKAIVAQTEEMIGSVYIYGAIDSGMRHIGMVSKPVTSLADIQGEKIRTASSAMLTEALQLLGCNPTPVDYTEVYSALKNGQVTGEDVNYGSAYFQNHFEVLTNWTEIGMYPYPSFNVFNKDFVDSLPEGYWDFMTGVMDECMEKFFSETVVQGDAFCKKGLEENGVVVSELTDFDAWVEAVQPVIDKYTGEDADPLMKDFVVAVEAMKEAE